MESITKAHIKTLMDHGAKVGSKADNTMQDLTVEFVEEAIASCVKNNYTAVTFDLALDGIYEDMAIAIWKNGHVDTGSMKNILDCLTSEWR